MIEIQIKMVRFVSIQVDAIQLSSWYCIIAVQKSAQVKTENTNEDNLGYRFALYSEGT